MWARSDVAVLDDGRVATGGDNRVLVWDPDRPGKPLELGRHDDRVLAVAVLDDGRVATGGDNRVLVWDPDRPGTSLELGRHDNKVKAVGVLTDDIVVTSGHDSRVRVWDTQQPVQQLAEVAASVSAVAVSRPGQGGIQLLAAVGRTEGITLWTVTRRSRR